MAYNTTREHTTKGNINWRGMKRIHKRNMRNAAYGHKGGIIAARKFLRTIEKENVGTVDFRYHLHNVINWL